MGMRRIARDWNKLADQLRGAAMGIAGEPSWPPSAPTQVEVESAADAISDARTRIIELENEIASARFDLAAAMTTGNGLMRKIISYAEGLLGSTVGFGVRPLDGTRNSPGPTPQVKGLVLSDGGSGAIGVKWKGVPRATYEVQWFADEFLAQLMGALASTRRTALVPALAPGAQIWLRVRALRGGKYGEWSETATRIANV